MTYEDQELEPFQFLGCHYNATKDQANDLWAQVSNSVDGIRHDQIEKMLDTIHMDAADPKVLDYAESLCHEHALLTVKLTEMARGILRGMGVVA